MTDAPSHLFYQTRAPRPFLSHGEGIYLYDESGKRYIDGSSGAMVSNIGHSNPRVLAKMKDQMDRATFGYRLHFRTHPSEDLAAKLAGLMPGDLDRVFFVSGGSEAVETAEKLAVLEENGMTISAPSETLSAELAEIGETMTAEWLEEAGEEGQSVVDAYHAE